MEDCPLLAGHNEKSNPIVAVINYRGLNGIFLVYSNGYYIAHYEPKSTLMGNIVSIVVR